MWRIYTSVNFSIIGSDNGLSPVQRQAIIWTNDGMVYLNHGIVYLNQFWFIFYWTLGNTFQWNFNENTAIFIQENELENVVSKNGNPALQ